MTNELSLPYFQKKGIPINKIKSLSPFFALLCCQLVISSPYAEYAGTQIKYSITMKISDNYNPNGISVRDQGKIIIFQIILLFSCNHIANSRFSLESSHPALAKVLIEKIEACNSVAAVRTALLY